MIAYKAITGQSGVIANLSIVCDKVSVLPRNSIAEGLNVYGYPSFDPANRLCFAARSINRRPTHIVMV